MARRSVGAEEREILIGLSQKIEAVKGFREGKYFFQTENRKYSGGNSLMRYERELDRFDIMLRGFISNTRGAPSKQDIISFRNICNTFGKSLAANRVVMREGVEDVLDVYENLFNDLHESINEYCLNYNIGVDNDRRR